MQTPDASTKTRAPHPPKKAPAQPDYIRFSVEHYADLAHVVGQAPHVVLFASEQTKARGNEHFINKDLAQALHFYLLSVAFFRHFCPLKRALVTERKTLGRHGGLLEPVLALLKALFLNLAAVYLKREQPDEVVRACDEALQLEANCAKALYRKAKAYMQFKNLKAENWGLAVQCLEAALRAEPEQPEIALVLTRARQQHSALRSSDARQKLEEFTSAYKTSPEMLPPRGSDAIPLGPEKEKERPAVQEPVAR